MIKGVNSIITFIDPPILIEMTSIVIACTSTGAPFRDLKKQKFVLRKPKLTELEKPRDPSHLSPTSLVTTPRGRPLLAMTLSTSATCWHKTCELPSRAGIPSTFFGVFLMWTSISTRNVLAVFSIAAIFMNCTPSTSTSTVDEQNAPRPGAAEQTGISKLSFACRAANEQNDSVFAVFPAFDHEWTKNSRSNIDIAQFDANLKSAKVAGNSQIGGVKFFVRQDRNTTTITLTSALTAFEKRQFGAGQIKISIAERRPATLVTATLTSEDGSNPMEMVCSQKKEVFSIAKRSEIIRTAEEFIANTIGSEQSVDPDAVTFFSTHISYARLNSDSSGAIAEVTVRTLADFPSSEGASDCSTVVRVDSPSEPNGLPLLSAQDIDCDVAD